MVAAVPFRFQGRPVPTVKGRSALVRLDPRGPGRPHSPRRAVQHVDTAPAARTALWFHAINRTGTVELLLLAVFVATVTAAAGRAAQLPALLRGLGAVLVPLLVLGGTAFAVGSEPLAVVLAVSLVVLLVRVGAVARRIGRHRS